MHYTQPRNGIHPSHPSYPTRRRPLSASSSGFGAAALSSWRPPVSRQVSLVGYEELEFPGTLTPQQSTVLLADVDNDRHGNSELVVGSADGVVAVFKGLETSQPWWSWRGLGTISCVAVGNVWNRRDGRNSLVVVAAEGWCHIFDLQSGESGDEGDEGGEEEMGGGAGAGDGEGDEEDEDSSWGSMVDGVNDQAPVTHIIPCNVSSALIYDVDGDGRLELVLGGDRCVYVYSLGGEGDGGGDGEGGDGEVEDGGQDGGQDGDLNGDGNGESEAAGADEGA